MDDYIEKLKAEIVEKGEEITRLKSALVDARDDVIRLHKEKMRYFEALLLIAGDDKMTGVITDKQRTMWLIAKDALNAEKGNDNG